MSANNFSIETSITQDMRNTRNAELLTLEPHPVTGRLIDSHPGVRTRPMQTISILTALEQLGYNPYHMAKAMKSPKLSFALWLEALRAKFHPQAQPNNPPLGKTEFDKILADYDGVSDVPTICFAEELIKAYPDAKVVLNTRDVDAWLHSMDSTAGTVLRWRGWEMLSKWDPALAGPWWEHGKVVLPAAYGTLNDFSPQGPAREAFRAHYARIREVTPKERLLEFRVQDGWEPLCEFLGKEVPQGEFPRANDAAEFVRMHAFMWWLAMGRMVGSVALNGAPVLAAGVAVWWRVELGGVLGRWVS